MTAASSDSRIGFVSLASLADIPEGRAQVFAVRDLPGYSPALEFLDELRIAVARAGEVVYAIEDRCSHDSGPLGQGEVHADPGRPPEITCHRHGARFDLKTGKATRMPAISPVAVYPVRVVEGEVEIDLSDA